MRFVFSSIKLHIHGCTCLSISSLPLIFLRCFLIPEHLHAQTQTLSEQQYSFHLRTKLKEMNRIEPATSAHKNPQSTGKH